MENMGAVFVHVDTFDIFAKDIPSQLRALVNDEAFLPVPMGEVRESSAEEAGAYDKIIEITHLFAFHTIERF